MKIALLQLNQQPKKTRKYLIATNIAKAPSLARTIRTMRINESRHLPYYQGNRING